MSSIGSRLIEERKRLGYSQSDFGELGGVKRQAQGNYESDDRRPDADYLAGIANAGANIIYIVTGKKSEQLPFDDQVSEAKSYVTNIVKGLKQILLEPEIKREWVERIDGWARDLYQVVLSTKNDSKPFDQEALEIAIECVDVYIEELGLKVTLAKKAKVIRMLYPLIRDDDDSDIPDNVIDLLQLAEEEVQEQGELDEQQKEKVVK